MEFCEKCGALMLPKKGEKKKTVLKCRECGWEKAIKRAPEYHVNYRVSHTPREKIIVVDKDKDKPNDDDEELTEDERRERRKEILEFYEEEGESGQE